LMYHSISNEPKTEVMRSIHVSPAAFKTQMRLLKLLGFRGCSIAECMTAMTSGNRERLVALTFDDGYENFFEEAIPVLDSLSFTATVYVISDCVGGSNIWDRATGISEKRLMSWQQLRLCRDKGHEIGCHSRSHISLIDKESDLIREIMGCKREIELNLEVSPTSFCYPYGHYDSQVMQAVESAGFTNATTMVRGRATKMDNKFELPRIPITWHTLPHLFAIKLLTNYEDKRRNR